MTGSSSTTDEMVGELFRKQPDTVLRATGVTIQGTGTAEKSERTATFTRASLRTISGTAVAASCRYEARRCVNEIRTRASCILASLPFLPLMLTVARLRISFQYDGGWQHGKRDGQGVSIVLPVDEAERQRSRVSASLMVHRDKHFMRLSSAKAAGRA